MPNQIIASPELWSDRIVNDGGTFSGEQAQRLRPFGIATKVTSATVDPATSLYAFGIRNGFFDAESSLVGPLSFLGLAGLRPQSAHRNMLSESVGLAAYWTVVTDSVVTSGGTDPFNGNEADGLELSLTPHSPTEKYISKKIENRGTTLPELTVSVYLKADVTNGKVGIGEGATYKFARFDLSGAGSVINVSSATATIERVGVSAWYFCTVTATVSSTSVWEMRIGVLNTSDTDLTDETDTTAGILIHGPQVEIGTVATSERHRVETTLNSDSVAATFRLQLGTDSTYATWDWDSGLQMIAQDQHDFRQWEKIHVPYKTGITAATDRFLYAKLSIYDEAATTVQLGRLVMDNAWITPLVPSAATHLLTFTEPIDIQHTDGGVSIVRSEEKKRSALYVFNVLSDTDAYDQYEILAKMPRREIFFVLNDTPGRMQRESVFGVADWQPLVRSGNIWRGGINILEF